MKALLIKSGLNGIYPFLEDALQASWAAIGHNMKSLSLSTFNTSSDQLFDHFDLVLMLGGFGVHPKKLLASSGRRARTAIWQTEDPFYIEDSLKLLPVVDHLFSVDEGAQRYYRSKGFNHTSFLPLGTFRSVFHPRQSDASLSADLLLIGYPYPNRLHLIRCVLNRTRYYVTVAGKGWYNALTKRFRHHPRLNIINRWLTPEEAARRYCNARVVLNPHRSAEFPLNKNRPGVPGLSLNNRTFDVAACRAFQLVDRPLTKASGFTDDELITYASTADGVKKIDYFLNHPAQRARIAEKAWQRVIQEHLMSDRAASIVRTMADTGSSETQTTEKAGKSKPVA